MGCKPVTITTSVGCPTPNGAAHRERRRVARRDPWGNTALHVAAANPCGYAQAAWLLAHGANPNAAGAYGLTPWLTALSAGRYETAALLRKGGAQAHVAPFNEASERSFLANLFGITGVTRLHGTTLALGGAFDFGVYERLVEGMRAYVTTHGSQSLLLPHEAQALLDALQSATWSVWASPHAVRRRLLSGHGVLLPTGWRGHSHCVALLGNQGVRVDRLHMLPWQWANTTFGVMVFKGGAPSERRLQTLRARRHLGPWQGFGRMRLSEIWRLHKTSRRLRRVLDAIPMQGLHADNCAVANAKAGLLAMMTLLTQRRPQTEGAPEPAALRGEYKKITTFLRRYFLRRYVGLHRLSASSVGAAPFDAHLVALCGQKLLKPARQRWRLTPMPVS